MNDSYLDIKALVFRSCLRFSLYMQKLEKFDREAKAIRREDRLKQVEKESR